MRLNEPYNPMTCHFGTINSSDKNNSARGTIHTIHLVNGLMIGD